MLEIATFFVSSVFTKEKLLNFLYLVILETS